MADPFARDDLLANWRDLPFEPFRDGIEIHHIQKGAPAMAILRYGPGASVPKHRHPGQETILVLDGTQSDERGTYSAGSLIVNPVGSVHSVWSQTGCAVLIQWNEPVEFV